MIELMIVVVIIGILAGLAIPRFSGATQLTKQHEAHLILKQVLTFQEAYREQYGAYAGSTSDLEPLGYSPRPLTYYSPPTITAAGATFLACMQAINPPSLGDRSIDHTGDIGDC